MSIRMFYKHNTWPMQRLAELRPRWQTPRSRSLALQARLLGISGLLPVELTRTRSTGDKYVREVWDQWWRERDEFSDCILPRDVWHFHALRPANHPQRRLALASRWCESGDLVSKLERWCTSKLADEKLPESLLEIFQVEPDDFWSWHYKFIRSPRLKRSQPLLGSSRVTDLAVNVMFPWLWTRAAEGKSAELQNTIERRYFAWPAAEDNSVLRLARQRLLGGNPAAPSRAAAQQGLLQIVRDFCDHSNALCENCKLPTLVREFS